MQIKGPYIALYDAGYRIEECLLAHTTYCLPPTTSLVKANQLVE